jgi:hypothetical protein
VAGSRALRRTAGEGNQREPHRRRMSHAARELGSENEGGAYSKYPVTSRITSTLPVLPVAMSTRMLTWFPLALPTGMMAPLATALSDVTQLMTLASGMVVPAG